MKQFIKDNLVLMLGVSLPLVLVVLFMLAGTLPKYFVAQPQYDVLFTDNMYSHVEFRVQQKKLHLKIDPARLQPEAQLPRLYRYIAATGKVEEIAYAAPDMSSYQGVAKHNQNGMNANIVIAVDPTKLPSDQQAQDTSNIVSQIGKNANAKPFIQPVAEAASLTLNSAPYAPDGYQFLSGGRDYRGALMLMGSGRSYEDKGPVLNKNGRIVAIPYTNENDPYNQSPRFIGWIVP